MNRSEINNALYEIREKCNEDNAEEYIISLQDIFKLKPVTILYFNVKAKLLCQIGKYEEAVETLKAKINLCFPEEEYIESCSILQKAYKAMKRDTFYRQFCCLEHYIRYMIYKSEEAVLYVEALEEKIIKLEDDFLTSLSNNKILSELSDAYFESSYITEAIILYALEKKEDRNDLKESLFFTERIAFETNYTFLLEQLLYKNGLFILVANENNYTRWMVIAKALNKLNQKVFVLMPSVLAEVEDNIEIDDTIDISMNNIEIDEDGISRIRPIEIVHNSKLIGNNTHFILEKLSQSTENDFSILLGTGSFFEALNNIMPVKNRVQRLSQFRGDFFEDSYLFGYFGKYTSYISNIYGFDVQSEISKPSECEFSIVIPVKNSVESLRYTLQTCLEQRGIEDTNYEIVVSDNSTSGYMEIEKLVNEINDSRIKYFRTPKELPLARSFEYAFLKSKGDFVFSIGADDAVLPWGLQIIKEVLARLPDDDIIQWDRGFFVWPNNDRISSQAGQFLIPRPYKNGNIKIEIQKSIDNLIRVVANPNQMYGMPMLYINSGFRRRYINKLLECTGKLWDGLSQDIYTGLVNLLINETIPLIEYPITIAGMTALSEGINGNMGNSDNEAMIKKIIGISALGMPVPYGNCMKFLYVELDTAMFYSSFFRVLELDKRGTMKTIASQVDWKKVFEIVATGLTCYDLAHDINIKSLRYSAYYHSNEIGKWFDDNILDIIMSPKTIVKKEQKNYSEGFTSEGGLQLDARKFNVTNIHEATKLFEKISNL